MSLSGYRLTGTLARWDDDRGFGFINPSGGGADVFVHITGFLNQTLVPTVGEQLSFDVDVDSAGGPRARNVTRDLRTPGSARTRRLPRAHPRGRNSRRSTVKLLRSLLVMAGASAAFVTAQFSWELPIGVGGYLLVVCVITFLAYGSDKRAATTGGWRISEATLLLLGLMGGWPGGLVAQETFRHKTSKPSFVLAFWTTVVVNVAVTTIAGLVVFGHLRLG
jgi:uncharacterized membrane protein YsdA (DUF1294 family)/cold shock CspA family protein